MEWRITATKSDEAWFDDHIDQILMAESYRTPSHSQRIGHVECIWREVEPGLVYIAANPNEGSPDDRIFAERVVFEQLKPLGFKHAHVKLGAGSWGVSDPVQAKAVRMVQSGGVHLDRNSQDVVVAHVQGEGTDNKGTPDTHNVEIRRQNPQDPEKVTGAFCDCDWGQFMNTPRTRQWKAFQFIPCSHIVATSWVSMSVPRDEDRAPGNQGPDQGGQMSLFDMSGGQAPSSMGIMQQRQPAQPPVPQGDQMQMAPPPEDVLPQFPMDQQQQLPPVNPASVPGGNPGPTPTNPLQYPGGTFSSYRPIAQQQYQNGQIVDLLQPTQGTQVGRSQMHGAGQPIDIPAGRSGEVLGTDPITGMVEVLFMDKDFDQNTFFEPFGARVWCWPSEIRPSRQRAPAPNVRRLTSA